MEKIDEIKKYFKKYRLEELLKIEDYSNIRLRKVERGNILINFGDKLTRLVFLVEGAAKVYPITDDGNTQILDFIYSLEVLGDIELVVGKNAYNTVEAISKCTLIEIDIKKFKEILKGNDELYMFLCKTIARKLTATTNRLVMMKAYPAKRRLYNYIVKLRDNENKLSFDSFEMASVLGISDRYLRTLLKELELEMIIEQVESRRIKHIRILNLNHEYYIDL